MSGLLERGVLVRGGGALGCEGALRVTYGTGEENLRFLDALEEVLQPLDGAALICYKRYRGSVTASTIASAAAPTCPHACASWSWSFAYAWRFS